MKPALVLFKEGLLIAGYFLAVIACLPLLLLFAAFMRPLMMIAIALAAVVSLVISPVSPRFRHWLNTL
jgi:membrane protein YdbS with pleckstrin-like domain